MQFYNRLYCKARKITTKKTQAKNMVPSDFRGRNKWDLKICTFLTVCKLCFSFVLQYLLFTQPPEAVSIKFDSVVYDYLIFYGFRKKNWWKFELIFSACRSPPGISWFCFKGTRAIISDEPFLKVAFSETFWSLLDKKRNTVIYKRCLRSQCSVVNPATFFLSDSEIKDCLRYTRSSFSEGQWKKLCCEFKCFLSKLKFEKFFWFLNESVFVLSLWTRKKDPKAVMNL